MAENESALTLTQQRRVEALKVAKDLLRVYGKEIEAADMHALAEYIMHRVDFFQPPAEDEVVTTVGLG